MPTESELLHTWRSAPNRPNVLVLAPSEATYLPHLMEMRETDGCEVVHVKTGEAAIRLLRRGAIAILVVDGQATEPGTVELLVEALNKDDPPRLLILSTNASARGAYESRQVRRVRMPLDKDVFQKILRSCAKEFGGQPMPVSVSELLEAIQELPDPGWLRITDRNGRSGDLCFQNTNAVYAESGAVAGAEAASMLAQWPNCRFEWRELPPYLQSNVDIPLADLTSGSRKEPAPAAASSQAAPPSFLMQGAGGEFSEAAVEEPAEFSLEGELFGGDAESAGLLFDLPGQMDWDQGSPEPAGDIGMEWGIEEPTDLSLDFTTFEVVETLEAVAMPPAPPAAPPQPPARSIFEMPAPAETAEPAVPAAPPPAPLPAPPVAAKPAPKPSVAPAPPPPIEPIDLPYPDPELNPDLFLAPTPPRAAPPERPESIRVSSTLFKATAIINDGGTALESCTPAAEAPGFDVSWLVSHYRQVADHLRQRGMGDVTELPMLGSEGGLVLSPLPDGRMLVVRLRSEAYGWEERDELQRLRMTVLSMGTPVLR